MKFIFLFFLCFPIWWTRAQNSYKVGDIVKDFVIKNILNYPASGTSLQKLKSQVTILDFFGTWCAPCLKAIPKLTRFQTKFKEDLNIVFISTEKEKILSDFVNKNKPFAFPVVIDTDETISNLFQPPSYPYTLILDNNFKIFAITNGEELTEALLENLIKESKKTTKLQMEEKQNEVKTALKLIIPVAEENNILQLSQDLMYEAKTKQDTKQYTDELQQLNLESLKLKLKTDDEKKAFWINIYNAFTNIALHQNPSLYKKRNKFFKSKNIIIANNKFSLDQIEHDLLRRSKIKWSLGYFNKLFPKAIEKQLRVEKVDWRIHFALNCGAKSCPPIAFYQPGKLNQQLDAGTTNYLTGECNWNEEKTKLGVPVLFSWFRKDFGGKKNILPILKKYKIIKENENPKVYFRKYNWDLYLENYQN